MPQAKKTLVAISGPTAIGKTALAIKLGTYFNTEIISADSRQFYKEMSIGTAVPDADELTVVSHHFIQHKSIYDAYNVGHYEKEAIEKINLLFKKYDVLILAGGSGLYIKAILEGLDEFPKIAKTIRQNLNIQLEQEGITALQKLLKEYDPLYYEKADIKNPQRIIRALEVYIQTGKPYSSFLQKKKKQRPFNAVHLALQAPRAIIYERINLRVEQMMKAGLLKEASKLHPFKHLNALQTVGYKELFQYLEGEISLDFAISEIKKNTRRYAKRQLTWLRSDPSVIWFDHDAEFEDISHEIRKHI